MHINHEDTNLPNVHATVTCDNYTYSLGSTVTISRNGVVVGDRGVQPPVYGKSRLTRTANAPTEATGNYQGEIGVYVVAPPGYTPATANLYAAGPINFLDYGICGGRADYASRC